MNQYLDLEIEEANDYYAQAYKDNNLEIVTFLVEKYPELDIVQGYPKETVLTLLCQNDSQEILDYLINKRKSKFITDTYRKKGNQLIFDLMWSMGQTNNSRLLKHILDYYNNELGLKGLENSLSTCLSSASCYGNFDMVKYITLNSELKSTPKLSESNYTYYQSAVGGGHLDIIKFYLFSSELKYKPKATTYKDYGLKVSAWKNHMHMVEYFLTSDEIEEKSSIHCQNESVLHAAIRNENIEMLEFVLKSPKLKEHADLHHKNDLAFRTAVKDNKLITLQYLICDYEIEKSPEIEKAIKKRKDIQKMFEMRSLYKKLTSTLLSKENKIKKEKI